ncbi:hypothetical protein ES705_02965 [subsurface metagenome]
MIKKTCSILTHKHYKWTISVYLLLLFKSLIFAQDPSVTGSKNWINKLTKEDQQQIVLANQNLKLANGILAEADSMENEIKLIKSSGDTTELKKIDVLSENISRRRYNAYQIITKANNSKILIYSASINKEISKIDTTTEYFEKISKLLKTAKNNLDRATILRKELIAEKDTNQIFEKSISSNALENEIIQNFEEIFAIMMMIEEDSVNLHDSAYISQIEKDALDVTIDTSFSFIDKRLVTVQDSEENIANEKSVAVQRSLLNFKKDTHKIAIGTGDPAKYVNVIVNEKVVETIKLAIENYEKDTVFDIFNITAFDIDLIRNAWDNYVEEKTTVIESDIDIQYDIEDEDDLTLATIDKKKTDDNNMKNAKEVLSQDLSSSIKDAETIPYEQLIFRVQIAADRVPINNKKLKSIYNGNRKIKMFQEENWYKYYIADCITLKEAIVFKKESKVPDAFIMVYKNGEKEQLYLSSSIKDAETIPYEQLIFRVQIAADRVPINNKKLKSIYNGNRKIKMFQEENWYKYYIADCITLKEAIVFKKESKVPDAFIMVYKNGEKEQFYLKYVKSNEIKETFDEYRDLAGLSKDKTTIVVQIAATKLPMSYENLKKIYKGNEQINYIKEEGWHKYSIGNFRKFKQANTLRKKTGVTGAFVVAYKNGIKIDI